MKPEDIAILRDLLDRASPRPWKVDIHGCAVGVAVDAGVAERRSAKPLSDSMLLVAAVNAIESLLDELEETRRDQGAWRDKAMDAGKHPAVIALLAERDAALAQLPEGMKHCTIFFKECDKGHGWLTATNWVQHDCQQCALDETRGVNEELSVSCFNAAAGNYRSRLASVEAERDVAQARVEHLQRVICKCLPDLDEEAQRYDSQRAEWCAEQLRAALGEGGGT